MSLTSNYPCPRCGHVVNVDSTHCGTCGQHQVHDDPPEAWIGRTIDGKYAVTGVLGLGGMGMVFRATRLVVGDEVALKVLFPRFLESPLQRQLFRDEGIAAARLAHRNVVTVFDGDLGDGDSQVAYIAMELLQGETYKVVLRERAPMAPIDVIPIMLQVCDGLTAAHDKRIIHRDLKPDNIFLEARRDGSTRVKLVDFGIAAMLDHHGGDDQRRLLGTLRYMAPEQCVGEPVDARSDLYALGVVIYESLTRRRATGKTISAVVNSPVKRPNLVLPDDKRIPAALEDLVMRLLAKAPAERPASAREVKGLLQTVLNQLRLPAEDTQPADPPEPVESNPSPSPTTPALQGPRRGLWWGLGIALSLGVIAGIVWGLLSSR